MFEARETMTGIDLGTKSVKLVRATAGKGFRRLLNVASAEIPEGDGWPNNAASMLEGLLNACRLKPRDLGRVSIAVSGNSVHLRQVDMPTLSEGELRSSLRYEARQHLPIENLGDAALDCQVVSRGAADGSSQSVLMVGAPDALVRSRVKVLETVGIEPEIVDVVPLALLNALDGSDPEATPPNRTIAVVDLGAAWTTFVFVRRGGVVYSRHVAVAPGPSALHVVALVQSLRETANFYSQLNERRPVDQVYLAGGGALVSGICENLADQLGLRVALLDATRRLTYAPQKGHGIPIEELAVTAPKFGVALGMLYWGDGRV